MKLQFNSRLRLVHTGSLGHRTSCLFIVLTACSELRGKGFILYTITRIALIRNPAEESLLIQLSYYIIRLSIQTSLCLAIDITYLVITSPQMNVFCAQCRRWSPISALALIDSNCHLTVVHLRSVKERLRLMRRWQSWTTSCDVLTMPFGYCTN